MGVLVATVGGNSLPCYFSAVTLHQHGLIDAVWLVHSTQTQGAAKRIQQILESRKLSVERKPLGTDLTAPIVARQMDAIASLAEETQQEVHLDYTGGTKTMSDEARRAFEGLVGDDRAWYVDEVSGRLRPDDSDSTSLQLCCDGFSPDLVCQLNLGAPLDIETFYPFDETTVTQVADWYCDNNRGRLDQSGRIEALHEDLQGNGLAAEMKLKTERMWLEHLIDLLADRPAVIQVAEWYLNPAANRRPARRRLEALHDEFPSNSLACLLTEVNEGTWLECLVQHHVSKIDGSSVQRSVSYTTRATSHEIDVVFVSGHRLVALECGMEDNPTRSFKKAYKAAAVNRHLGGDHVRTGLVLPFLDGSGVRELTAAIAPLFPVRAAPLVFGAASVRAWLDDKSNDPQEFAGLW